MLDVCACMTQILTTWRNGEENCGMTTHWRCFLPLPFCLSVSRLVSECLLVIKTEKGKEIGMILVLNTYPLDMILP